MSALPQPRRAGWLRVAAAPEPDPDVDTLARTLWGEARGEGLRGLEAVAAVVMNRVARTAARGGYWWGATVREVCRKRWQFSCWNEGDPSRPKLLAVDGDDREFALCLRIARRAVRGTLEDRTGGATHYHARHVHPAWAAGRVPSAEIGHHLFYNDVE